MNWKNFVCSVVCLAGMTCAEAVNYTPENVHYSVPDSLVGEKVHVKVYSEKIVILYGNRENKNTAKA